MTSSNEIGLDLVQRLGGQLRAIYELAGGRANHVIQKDVADAHTILEDLAQLFTGNLTEEVPEDDRHPDPYSKASTP